MNIRFRMPKLWGGSQKQGALKEITLSTIATSISIILTFGTAHYLDEMDKKAAARQTAMMVIHDMDNSIEVLRNKAKDEKKYHDMTQDVIAHLAEIESQDENTLWRVFNYIAASSDQKMYTFDESSERVFLSSQDSWKNFDNPTFIDEVQKFYTTRHDIYDYINSSPQWRQPIGSQVLYQHQLNNVDGSTYIHQLLRETITSKEVRYYLNYSIGRQVQLNQFADDLQHISNVCKFNMGITDEELEEYVKNKTRTGRDAKEREIIGLWIISSTDNQYCSIEYFANHTYTQTVITYQPHPLYDGNIELKNVYTGTWQLHDDTLYNELKLAYKCESDFSHITPKSGYEQNVEKIIEKWKQLRAKEEKDAQAAKGVRPRTYRATINGSGNKIELKWTEKDEEGNDKEETIYLSRKKGRK